MANDSRLSHLDESGRARMVDVGGKPVTDRRAVAEGRVRVGPDVAAAIRANDLKKGDLLQVARLGGVQTAKRTSDLVLLCHPLPLTHIDVDARLEDETVVISASARTAGQTGVEMEALAAVAGAALNVVDMGKSLNPGIVIESLRVVEKRGGKSGLKAKQSEKGPRVAILTVSDSRAAGTNEDLATPALTAAVEELLGGEVVSTKLVPDDADVIQQALRVWSDGADAPELILTTGGTGVGPRDVTPEATAAVDRAAAPRPAGTRPRPLPAGQAARVPLPRGRGRRRSLTRREPPRLTARRGRHATPDERRAATRAGYIARRGR